MSIFRAQIFISDASDSKVYGFMIISILPENAYVSPVEMSGSAAQHTWYTKRYLA